MSKFWKKKGVRITRQEFDHFLDKGFSTIVDVYFTPGGEGLSESQVIQLMRRKARMDRRELKKNEVKPNIKTLYYCARLNKLVGVRNDAYQATCKVLSELKNNTKHYKKEVQDILSEGLTREELDIAAQWQTQGKEKEVAAQILIDKLRRRVLLSGHVPGENSDLIAFLTIFEAEGMSWNQSRENIIDDCEVSPNHYKDYTEVFEKEMALGHVMLDKTQDESMFGVRALLKHYLKRPGALHYKKEVRAVLDDLYGENVTTKVAITKLLEILHEAQKPDGGTMQEYTKKNPGKKAFERQQNKEIAVLKGDLAAVVKTIMDQTTPVAEKFKVKTQPTSRVGRGGSI